MHSFAIMVKPKQLFKYEKINSGYGLENLRNGIIYFNRPSDFNDPFDCNMGYKIHFNPKNIDKIFERYSELDKIKLLKLNNTELIDLFKNQADLALKQTMENMRNNYGIACFSELNNNLLMWSHYADSGKGFCIEFDTNYPPFTLIGKVNYSDELPIIDTYKILFSPAVISNPMELEVSKLWLTKSRDWSYEQEWRAGNFISKFKFRYQKEALKSIYFGPHCAEDDIQKVCAAAIIINPKIIFFKGKKSESEFKIVFKQLNSN